MSNRSPALPRLIHRLVALALLLACLSTAHAYGTVDPSGSIPAEGGCINAETTGELTGFCGPTNDSFNAQCQAYWQSVVAPELASQAQGYGGGWGGFCALAFNGTYAYHLTGSTRNSIPACPGNATRAGSGCLCNDGFAADPDHAQCVPIVIRRPPHDCPLCDLLAGNPIVPLRGVKKEFVDTGLRIGGTSLRLTYDTTGKVPGTDAETAAMVFPMQALGDLWFSSLHRRVVAGQGRLSVLVERGDGRAVAYAADGAGGYTAPADSRGRLQALGSGYRYTSVDDGSVEDYNDYGQITAIVGADGSRVTFTYSGPYAWAYLGKAGYYFWVDGPRRVRYGSGTSWLEKTVSGNTLCSDDVFGGNPGDPKWCEVASFRDLLSVQDQHGRTIGFQYDAAGRLTRIDDTGGQSILLGYDAQSNLETVQWPDGRTRRFVYENTALPWAMTGVVDEAQARHSTFGYDAQGRAVSTEYAGGVNRFTASYVSGPSLSFSDEYDSVNKVVYRTYGWVAPQGAALTKPNGSSGALQATTIGGKTYLAGQGQPAGAGCAASSSAQTFDANGNVASKNDFNGTRSCQAFDLTRNLEVTRVEGLAAAADCASVTSTGATLPTGARKTSTQWHPDWSVAVKVAEPGQLTTSIYNGQPDPFNGNAIASCEPGTAPLPDGKPIAVLCKQAVQATTDANGRLGFGATLQAGAAIHLSTWTYNESGQVMTSSSTRDGITTITSSTYFTDTNADHAKGDLATTTDAAGKVTTYDKYTRAGQLLQSTDPDGVITVNTYDPRQRLLTTTLGGETTTYTYDPVGQLTRVTQHDGSWIAYEYDDAHRQKAVTDDSGNRIEYALDNAGSSTGQTVKDPTGSLKRNMARVMDALGRAQRNTGRGE